MGSARQDYIECLERIKRWRKEEDKSDEDDSMVCQHQSCLPPFGWPCWCTDKTLDREELRKKRKVTDEIEAEKKKECKEEYDAAIKAEKEENKGKSF
jgi:hypothetical protein